MKTHAGSLTGNVLILYYHEEETLKYLIIEVDNQDLQWDMYCNDLNVNVINNEKAEIEWKGKPYLFPCTFTDNPFKTMGWGKQ